MDFRWGKPCKGFVTQPGVGALRAYPGQGHPQETTLKELRKIKQYQVLAQPLQGWVLNKSAYPG